MTDPAFPDPEFDDSLFRQRERTVDNIKRIYAFVYSISFANVIRDIAVYYEAHLSSTPPQHFTAGLWLRLIMLIVFTATISVFAFQADKFLDLRYALRPEGEKPDKMPRWRRADFALEAVGLIFSLVPFVLMSYAFEGDVVSHLGIFPFLASYILLFGLALLFLQMIRLRYLLFAPRSARHAGPVLSEDVRYGLLSMHWFLTNGILTALITLAYATFVDPVHLCGPAPLYRDAWVFLIIFAILAMVRNIWDYLSVWPFLYTNSRRVEDQDLTRFMRLVSKGGPESWCWWDLLGPAALVAVVFAFYIVGPFLSPSACPSAQLRQTLAFTAIV